MKIQHAFALTVAVAVLGWAAGAAFTEDEQPKKPLSPAQMEAQMMQLGGMGPEHDHLKMFVGTWRGEGKAYTYTMGAFPVQGMTTMKPIMGGRYVQADYEGPGPMGTMHGTGHVGFNRMAKEFESTWMMSMGTAISFVRGTYDAETKTFTMRGTTKMIDGTSWGARQTMQFTSADTWIEKHYATPTGGKEGLSFEMTYTRVKKDAAK